MKIERLDAKTGVRAIVATIDDDTRYTIALSYGDNFAVEDFIEITDLSTAVLLREVLDQWIKTKEAEDEG